MRLPIGPPDDKSQHRQAIISTGKVLRHDLVSQMAMRCILRVHPTRGWGDVGLPQPQTGYPLLHDLEEVRMFPEHCEWEYDLFPRILRVKERIQGRCT